VTRGRFVTLWVIGIVAVGAGLSRLDWTIQWSSKNVLLGYIVIAPIILLLSTRIVFLVVVQRRETWICLPTVTLCALGTLICEVLAFSFLRNHNALLPATLVVINVAGAIILTRFLYKLFGAQMQ
jgi:hypothetical protein